MNISKKEGHFPSDGLKPASNGIRNDLNIYPFQRGFYLAQVRNSR